VLGKRRPGFIGDTGVGVEFVGSAKRGRLELGPSLRIGALCTRTMSSSETPTLRPGSVLANSYSERSSSRCAGSRAHGRALELPSTKMPAANGITRAGATDGGSV